MVRLTRGAWEDILPQGRHIAHTGFRGNLVQDFAREHFRAEDCRDLFAPQLVNQTRHFTGRGFRKIGWLHSPNNGQAVAAGKVRPGIVIREQLALVWLEGAHGSRNTAVRWAGWGGLPGGFWLFYGSVVMSQSTAVIAVKG